MLPYYFKCRENAESNNPKLLKQKNERIMLLRKCAVFDNKKSQFIKERKVSGLLSSLGIQTPLSKINLVGPLLY